MHSGTFKVFVNFMPVADITYLVSELYKNLHKKALQVASIYYCPPNYLRMAMYLELSRPKGDVSRWEKVLKRLTLLNKHYPLKGKIVGLMIFKGYFNMVLKIVCLVVEENRFQMIMKKKMNI